MFDLFYGSFIFSYYLRQHYFIFYILIFLGGRWQGGNHPSPPPLGIPEKKPHLIVSTVQLRFKNQDLQFYLSIMLVFFAFDLYCLLSKQCLQQSPDLPNILFPCYPIFHRFSWSSQWQGEKKPLMVGGGVTSLLQFFSTSFSVWKIENYR